MEKIIKLELIRGGDNPLIRATYKGLFGKIKERDIVKNCVLTDVWVFCNNNEIIYPYSSIKAFYESKELIQIIK
jgi:hypothetical protein